MGNRDILEAQVEAFNRKDADRLGELLAEDYGWFTVGAEGPVQASTGRAATVERMRGFFAAMPYARSRIEGVLEAGNLVAAVEIDTFEVDGKPVERRTLGVYEYRDGRLARAFAFPVAGSG